SRGRYAGMRSNLSVGGIVGADFTKRVAHRLFQLLEKEWFYLAIGLRCAAMIAVVSIVWRVDHWTTRGQELGFVLTYVALTGGSVLASHWFVIATVSFILLLPWTLFMFGPWQITRAQRVRWIARQFFVFANRQAENAESVLAPITLAIVAVKPPNLKQQLLWV